MKIILPIAIFLAALALLLPLLLSNQRSGDHLKEDNPSEISQIAAEPESTFFTYPLQNDNTLPSLDNAADANVSLRLFSGGKTQTLTLRDYLIGVVAAEMPASFEPEALKAQAAAARTYTYYRVNHAQSNGVHPDADTCDDPMHCKAWLSDNALRDKWGGSYTVNIEKITEAVDNTDGMLVMFDGEPILAVFHSSSGGNTEDSSNVWSKQLPYLQSVDSPETADSVPDFETAVTLSTSEFRLTALAEYPEMSLSGSSADWFKDVKRSDAGRIISLSLGGVTLTGTELRLLFGLRSANITWVIADGSITFNVVGYGHGVGLSQYGANELAKQGMGYKDILLYYYRGSDVCPLSVSG
ncbi:MAG: stage II sporulation protein D [Oscillospiraceae bacterium]|jgi:stage II sporulation protein D|nr:stage II sporulation protein D [Oscillospiraceae bacterium]